MKLIAVIDDDSTIQNLLSSFFAVNRFRTVVAPDGEAGIKMIREFLPDLILCDVKMPHLDGYGVYRALRNDPLTAAIPFLFITGKVDAAEIRRNLGAEAIDCIPKPLNTRALLSAVSHRLAPPAATPRAGLPQLCQNPA